MLLTPIQLKMANNILRFELRFKTRPKFKWLSEERVICILQRKEAWFVKETGRVVYAKLE
jgi:hypothetical protein